MLTLLLSFSASAAPAGWSDCTSGAPYSGSDTCACLKTKATDPMWWGSTATGGAAQNIYMSPSMWDAPLGTCYETSAMPYVSGTVEKTNYAKGEAQANSVTKNIRTGATGGLYHWDNGVPEYIVWQETGDGSTFKKYSANHLGGSVWIVVDDETGLPITEVHASDPMANILEIIVVDLNQDGIDDIVVIWDNGEVWNAFGPFSMGSPITTP